MTQGKPVTVTVEEVEDKLVVSDGGGVLKKALGQQLMIHNATGIEIRIWMPERIFESEELIPIGPGGDSPHLELIGDVPLGCYLYAVYASPGREQVPVPCGRFGEANSWPRVIIKA